MVERFTPWDFLNGADADVLSCEDGRFVDFSDYEALVRQLAEARAELKLAIAEREFWRLADKNSVERAEVAEADRAELRAEVERLTPLAVAYDYLEAPDAALSGSGSGWRECATEGCDHPATVHFERGGIGSHYCHACYMRVQKLTAAQEGR